MSNIKRGGFTLQVQPGDGGRLECVTSLDALASVEALGQMLGLAMVAAGAAIMQAIEHTRESLGEQACEALIAAISTAMQRSPRVLSDVRGIREVKDDGPSNA